MVMEPGNPSRRHEAFPAGLRVLVVDDDPTWLKILEKMLKKCSYEVTTCGLARDALNLLRERKDGYDIVISDVNMPDMDGFKLLEHVGLEMDLPVIMMSVDGETSRVMKGVQHGACDYLLKPIRMKELRNIWQHVLRKRIHEGRDIDSHESFDGLHTTRSGSDRLDEFFYYGEDISGKKRKESENKHDDRDFCDSGSSTKKARVVWSVDLHQKFVKAVNQIGFDKVGPKRILDLMNVPWLTRENVASHLQKYRLYLTRLQKENDSKTSYSGMKPSDTTSQEPIATFSSQSSIGLPQEDIAASSNFTFSGSNFLGQSTSPKVHEIDHKAITPMVKEPKRGLTPVIPNQHDSRGMKVGYEPSIAQPAPEDRYPVVGPKGHCSWRGVPEVTFKQETDRHIHLEDSGHLLKHVNERPHLTEPQQTESVERKPLCADNRSNNTVQTRPEKAPNDFLGISDKGNILNYQVPQSIPVTLSSIQSEGFDLGVLPAPVSDPGSLTSVSGSIFEPSHGDLQVSWLQDDTFCTNPGIHNSEFSGYDNPCLIAEVPVHLYDALRFDYEQYVDPIECSIIDHGLFIT